MKGNFSRLTFDPAKRYSRVLQQQGQVQLDADWNEQAAIQLHYLRTLAADLIGPRGGPGDSFKVKAASRDGRADLADLRIAPGHYYVDGILCDNTAEAGYYDQPSYPRDAEREEDRLPDPPFLVYLDVWERHVTSLQDDAIREVALGGIDTATRAQVVWQVKVTATGPDGNPVPGNLERDRVEKTWPQWVDLWQPAGRGKLKARSKVDPDQATDPCLASPEARYRGVENQLYRVEVHSVTRNRDGEPEEATFKWSRDNGAVVFPVRSLQGRTVILEHLGRDAASGLSRGDWVELVEDETELRGLPGPLLQVQDIHRFKTGVILAPPEGVTVDLPDYDEEESAARHVFLRRWDQRPGDPAQGGLTLVGGAALFMKDGKVETGWLHLEDGVQVQFQAGDYRPGDYWLIPARTATGDVEWPGPLDNPEALPPHGVEHHYAPLALVTGPNATTDLRRTFKPLTFL